MSVIVKSKEEISKSPLNLSKSKQLYSFPRAERFAKIKNSSTSSTYFYNIPDFKTTRATSIGKGDKYDFTKDSKGKNAAFYNAKSDFDKDHPFAPKYTFGLGREFFGKVYYDTNKFLDKDIPGPGKYNILKEFGKDSLKCSFKGSSMEKEMTNKNKTPGPGEYPVSIQINKDGKYPASQFRNATKIIFGADKSQRFNYTFDKNPGPQRYNIDPLINGSGKLFVSKFRSSPGKSMAGRHDIKSPTSVPGPGAYNYFSEWGMYESKYVGNQAESSSRAEM